MPARKLKQFLDRNGVSYSSIGHPTAYTAPATAQSAHLDGRDFAKTVIVKMAGEMAMVVLPADRKIALPELRELLDREDLELASEAEFRDRFPDCEVGAMPPFGNLYGLPVYLARSLAEEREIAFNAGSHREVIKMSYADFADLVKPVVLDFVGA